MKAVYLPLIFSSFLLPFSVSANIDAKLASVIEIVAKSNVSNDISSTELGQKFCMLSGKQSYECMSADTVGKGICMVGGKASYECTSADTISKGICMAGGKASYECMSADTIAKGICMAGGKAGYECMSADTIAKGICLAKNNGSQNCFYISLNEALGLLKVDTEWKWDKFRTKNSYDNIWACRGTTTGEFADNSKCANSLKIDDTWPNN